MVRFAEDDTYGDQDVAYGDQDWAAGAYDDAAYAQAADAYAPADDARAADYGQAADAYVPADARAADYAQAADAYAPADAQATDAASDDAVYDATDYAEEDYGELDVAEPRFPELEAAAASHLQACERGRSTRKRHRAEKTAQAQGATALQARVRGRNERRRGRDFMRTPNAAAAAAPDPRTPGGGLKGAVAVRFAEPQLDDAPAAFRARRPPTPLPQLGAMAYDDDEEDEEDEVEEDAALATPRRDDAPAPEVDHVDVHADPSPTSVIASPPVRRSVGFSADPPKRARNVAADDEPLRKARFAADSPPRKARFAADSPKARVAADSPKARFAGDSPKARFAEEPSPPRRTRFAADSPPRRARFADAADTPPVARFPGASPPHAVAADSPLRRARFPGASPPHAADLPPRRRRTRFAETTTESPAPSDDDARSRRVHRAGGTPPAHRRRARAREPSPDASELHATRQASLAAAALDARKKRGPRDADDAMAFSPPGAYSPSRRDSDGAVRVQFVAGAAPDDAQPPLEEASGAQIRSRKDASDLSPVRHEPKSRLGVLEARLAALEAGRGPRRRKKAASRRRHEEEVHAEEEENADDEDASDGFLLAFLVAGGVDAPRAVRAAARLRLRGSYASSQAFATIPAATLQQAGLRAHEIRATLRAARLARQALRAAPQRRAKVKMSQSTGDADVSFADALKPRRAPRVDPNSWAHRRRALIRSAERRRRLRQTE